MQNRTDYLSVPSLTEESLLVDLGVALLGPGVLLQHDM
jgi:hypothetical protein